MRPHTASWYHGVQQPLAKIEGMDTLGGEDGRQCIETVEAIVQAQMHPVVREVEVGYGRQQPASQHMADSQQTESSSSLCFQQT